MCNRRIEPFAVEANGDFSDSLNFACLLSLIEQYGFPSEQLIGYPGYGKAWVIIHHNVRLSQNHQYLPMLKTALEMGAYQPEHYGWVVDQGQQVLGEKPIYFHWDVATNIDQLTNAEKQAFNAMRVEIGMPTLERIEVVNTKSGTKNRVKW